MSCAEPVKSGPDIGMPWNQVDETIIRFPVTPAMKKEELLQALPKG